MRDGDEVTQRGAKESREDEKEMGREQGGKREGKGTQRGGVQEKKGRRGRGEDILQALQLSSFCSRLAHTCIQPAHL